MSKTLTASDRKSLIRLASALPAGSPERRAILAGLQKAPVAKSAANATPAVEALMRDLGRIPGVDTVYITDTWSDGYFQLRVVLEPKEGPNALGGRSGKTIEFEYARGRWGKFFNIPNFAKIMAAIRKMVKKSDLTIDGIAGPKKVYEFQDRASKGSPRLSGYDDNEVAVELYDYSGARRASGKQARVKSKRESMRLMNGLEKQHGGRTKAYYEAVLKGVKDGVIAPSAVVGGGYKDGKKVAIKWLEGEIKSAPAKTAKGEWISEAIKDPGRLHRHFGIPEDEDIPMSKIDGEIAKLKKKEDRTAEETSLLRALNLAKTLKSKKG